MAEALAIPHSHRHIEFVRAFDTELRSPPRWRRRPYRPDHRGVDPGPPDRRSKRFELDPIISSAVELLQGAAATGSEMPAGRGCAPRAGGHHRDDFALSSAAAAHAKTGSDAITRRGERQKDRLTFMMSDPVAARPYPLDDKLDQTRRTLPQRVSSRAHGMQQPA